MVFVRHRLTQTLEANVHPHVALGHQGQQEPAGHRVEVEPAVRGLGHGVDRSHLQVRRPPEDAVLLAHEREVLHDLLLGGHAGGLPVFLEPVDQTLGLYRVVDLRLVVGVGGILSREDRHRRLHA